jgi:uncharacterized RDD family membrane protein YckC
MRCPKCYYISFGDDDRCRNCGYDFSLAVRESTLELPIHTADEPSGPLADLDLAGSATETVSAGAALGGAEPNRRRDAGPAPGYDLPLFAEASSAEAREPFAVRGAAPAASHDGCEEGEEHDPDGEPIPTGGDAGVISEQADHGWQAPVSGGTLVANRARSGARLLAATIDTLVLGSIDVAVLYFTLRLCGLQLGDVRMLPYAPMAAFLLLLNGGYAIVFTAAGGQTIGKMAARIRVVSSQAEDGRSRVSFRQATVRSAAYMISLLPAGLGFIVALFKADGRALHDRLAGTRVTEA